MRNLELTDNQTVNTLSRWLTDGGTIGYTPEIPSDHPDWILGTYLAKPKDSHEEMFHGPSLQRLAGNLPPKYVGW